MNDTNSNRITNINSFLTFISIIVSFLSIVVPIKTILFSNTPEKKWILVGAIVLFAISVLVLLIRRKKVREQKKQYIDDSLNNDFFREYWMDRCEKRPYVDIDCSLKEDFSDRKSVMEIFVKVFFRRRRRGTKYAVLMGMTGSGKTMAMVNFLMEHVNCSLDGNRSYKIRIFSMKNKDLWNDIDKNIDVKERGKYILLLDALDENKDAQNALRNGQIKAYMRELKEKTQDFARVVVSCRTQFFKYYEDEPGVNEKVWDKHYLAPFSATQVNDYLHKKFGVPSNNPKCEKARRIVFSCREEFCRPLILSWIDEIVEKVEITPEKKLSLYDIYTCIIEAWLNREATDSENNIVDTKKKEELERYMFCMADYLYRNSITEISVSDYNKFLSEYSIVDPDGKILERSLLSRNQRGYQFTHRSFYEFFLAKLFFQEPDKIQSLQGLDFGLKIFDELVAEFQKGESDNEEKFRVAKTLEKVGIEYCTMHQYKDAEDKLQLALKIGKEVSEQGPDEYNLFVTTTLNDLANLYNETHHYDEAEKKFKEALIILRKLAGGNEEVYILFLASTLNNLAILHYHTYKYKESEKEYSEALTKVRQLTNSNTTKFQYLISIILNNYANLHRDTRRYKRAKREYGKALLIRRKLAKQEPSEYLPNVAQTLNDLAVLHRATGQYSDAEKEYNEAMGIFENLAIDKPDACQPYMATILNNRGNLYREEERNNEAEEDYNKAMSIRCLLAERNPDAYRPYIARTMNNLATLHRYSEKYKDAEKEYMEALSNHPTDSDAAIIWGNFATLYFVEKEYESAITAYQSAQNYYTQLLEKYHNPFRPYLVSTLNKMVIAYRELGDTHNAEKIEKAIQEMYRSMPKIKPESFEYVDDVMHLFNNTRHAS